MELFSLDSVISIIVTCNCLPFSGSRSIFRRHVSWQVLKIAFRGPQTWNFSGGGHPETPPTRLVPSALAIMRPRCKNSSFGPVYASAETHLIEVCLVTLTVRSVCEREKEKRKWGTVHATPLSLPIKTGEWYLQRRSHSTGRILIYTAWKIWPDTLFIRDFVLLDVWFLCTVKVVPCEQKTFTHKLQPVENSSGAVPCEHNSTIILGL